MQGNDWGNWEKAICWGGAKLIGPLLDQGIPRTMRISRS